MLNDAAPPGKEVKYARPERERRFLLRRPPDGIVAATRITDRYLPGTRLRLRRAESLSPDGETESVIFKLTQKVPAPEGTPGLITTIYLDAAEHAVLERLPAASLTKIRLSSPPLGVDVFEGALQGLVIGEVEFDDDEALQRFAPPPTVVAEITADHRLTGGRLASTTTAEIAEVLAEYGR